MQETTILSRDYLLNLPSNTQYTKMTLYPKLITDALLNVRYPGTGKNIVEAEMLEDDLRIDGMNVSFSIIFEKSTDPFIKSVVKAAEAAIHTYVSKDVNVAVSVKTTHRRLNEPRYVLGSDERT